MTLGSLWLLLARRTRLWMAGGTLAVLAGTTLGLLSLASFVDSGTSEPLALLPSMALSLGGGYAVLFPGISASRCNVRIHRNWRGHPRTGRFLWILSLAVAVAGLGTCVAAGTVNPLAPGVLVWMFMGVYLALAGWATAIIGASAAARQDQPEPLRAGARVPGR